MLLMAMAVGLCVFCIAQPNPVVEFATKENTLSEEEIVGLVFRVADGDTLTLRDARGRKFKVRLYGIDSPESDQPMGRQAGAELARLVKGKNVRVLSNGLDRFGRTVGRVYLERQYINLEMVKRGFAWHYASFAPKEHDLAQAEREARKNRLGIWQVANPLPPWEFRKRFMISA
ncbi:MAG: thermonuclease family protein, partial [Victivallales bacterium]|nr:thermonuclease family protein [Victivallales bacterium]